jgi:hypothetical protein
MAPVIIHLEQPWVPTSTRQESQSVTTGGTTTINYYNSTTAAYGETTITPPLSIAGQSVLMECKFIGYFSNNAPVNSSTRHIFEFFTNLNSSTSQFYDQTDNQMMRPMVATTLGNNNFFVSSGPMLVKIPDGPFPFRIYVRRCDGGSIAGNTASLTSPNNNVPSGSIISAVFSFVAVE